MLKVLKYLLFAAMLVVLSVVSRQVNSDVSDLTHTFINSNEHFAEYTQFNQSVCPLKSDFAIAGINYASSSCLRLQNSGKRTGQVTYRFNSFIIKQGKIIADKVIFSQSYFKHFIFIIFTLSDSLYIMLGEFII